MEKKFWKEKTPEMVEKKWSDGKFDGQTFTTRMDPSAAATQYPTEYPIVSRRALRRVDVSYIGDDTDGDNTPGIVTLYRGGPLYRAFDAYTLPVAICYKGLSIPTGDDEAAGDSGQKHPNLAYNASFARSNITALAAAYATQLTDLDFLRCGYKTNIPYMHEGKEAAIGALIYYVSYFCNIESIIQAYNNLKAQKDQLVKMGFNAEAPVTIELMNLLSKAQVRSLFEQLGSVLRENYIDEAWMKEISVIGNIPSRDYFDVLSPLKAVSSCHVLPHLRIWDSQDAADEEETGDSLLFDSRAREFNKIGVVLNLPEGNPYSERHYTMEGLMQHILDLLNPVMALGFCRQVYWGGADTVDTPLEEYAQYMTVMSYMNDLITSIQMLLQVTSKISTAMVDLKTFLMLLQDRTELNGWLFGSTIAPTDSIRRQIEWFNYELVDQLMRAYYAGGASLVIDGNTRKWRATSIWDYDKGIPMFDFKEGGMAIAASVREVYPGSEPVGDDPMFDFPIVFTPNPEVRALYLAPESTSPAKSIRNTVVYSRHGEHAHIIKRAYTVQEIQSNPFTARLLITPSHTIDPVSDRMSIPVMVFEGSEVPSTVMLANAVRFMQTQFGICGRIYYGGFSEPGVPRFMYPGVEVMPAPSAIGFVTREFDAFPSIAEEYIRKTSPLRVAGGFVSLGFIMK